MPCPASRRALLGALSIVLLAILPAPLAAQAGASVRPRDRELRTVAESVTVIVTLGADARAGVRAITASDSFAIVTDSLTLDTWAVAARRLLPPDTDSAGAPLLRGIALGDPAHGARLTLSRLTAEERGEYRLALEADARSAAVRLRPAEWEALYVALLGIEPHGTHSARLGEPVLFEFHVSAPAAQLLAPPVAPAYPERMRREGRDGEVLAQFVVGRDGQVRVETFTVLDSTDPAFTEAVRQVLGRLRFEPALLHGMPVAQLVQQGFQFRM